MNYEAFNPGAGNIVRAPRLATIVRYKKDVIAMRIIFQQHRTMLAVKSCNREIDVEPLTFLGRCRRWDGKPCQASILCKFQGRLRLPNAVFFVSERDFQNGFRAGALRFPCLPAISGPQNQSISSRCVAE